MKFEVTTCDREKWQHVLHLIGLPKFKGRSAAGELNTFHFYYRNISNMYVCLFNYLLGNIYLFILFLFCFFFIAVRRPPSASAVRIRRPHPHFTESPKKHAILCTLDSVKCRSRRRMRMADADGGRQTADGGRRTADGGRRTADGGRRTADGGRRTADGGRRTADGGRRTADGGRRTDYKINNNKIYKELYK